MKKRTRRALIALVVTASALMLLVAAMSVAVPRYREASRKAWKDRVIPEIATLASDEDWLEQEIASLKPDEWWYSEHVILMGNGDTLVYANECSKSDWRIDDIFIAKGSDGKWYYSTCHFCVGMCALSMMQDTQPPDLPYFVERFHLRKFDGQSDECLKKTKTFPDDLSG